LEICGQILFVFSLKMPHQWGGVRQHGAEEEEAAKASSLGFAASASGAGFEPASWFQRHWNPDNLVNPV
jgi:hypothetical protein